MQRNSIYRDTVYTDTTYQTPNSTTYNQYKPPSTTSSWGSTIMRKLRIGTKPRPKSEHIECSRPYDPRYDSLRPSEHGTDLSPAQEEELLASPWYQKGVPREIALDILSQQEIGSFIVRESTSHRGCYALSVKVPKFDNPTGISHYLIARTNTGTFRLKGVNKEWPSLTALVTHHTVMPEMLPCTLRVPRNASNPTYRDCDNGGGGGGGKEEDEDYQRLADFSHMMTELKM